MTELDRLRTATLITELDVGNASEIRTRTCLRGLQVRRVNAVPTSLLGNNSEASISTCWHCKILRWE